MADWKDLAKSVIDNVFALILKLWWVWPILGVIVALRQGWIDERTLTFIADRFVGFFSGLKGLL